MPITESEALELLGQFGAIIVDSHVVYTSGKHGKEYVNKDAIYPHTVATARLCEGIAEHYIEKKPDVVIAPAVGGVILSQWVAHYLTVMTGHEVLGIYAEREEESVLKADRDMTTSVEVTLRKGDELVIKKPEFVIKRDYAKLVRDRKVLVVEDVLNTGGSVQKVVQATLAAGGNVIAVAALCNRGNVNPSQVGDVPEVHALTNVQMAMWNEADCPQCRENIPINTTVGKGREYLQRKQNQPPLM